MFTFLKTNPTPIARRERVGEGRIAGRKDLLAASRLTGPSHVFCTLDGQSLLSAAGGATLPPIFLRDLGCRRARPKIRLTVTLVTAICSFCA
jgi:hypothetical protein